LPEKLQDAVLDVTLVGAKLVDTKNIAKDEAGGYSGRVRGVRWNVQVEVEGLFKHCEEHGAIVDLSRAMPQNHLYSHPKP
jgi:hypothetical protein